MKAPPLLPEETYQRVLRVANLDGLSVLAIAGMLALAAASMHDFHSAAIGLAVAAAGAIELHGVGLLRAGEGRGMNWVLASQPYLLIVLLGYCALRLLTYDAALLGAAMTPEMRVMITEAGYDEAQFLRNIYTLVYGTLAAGTILLQGGMTFYYARRRRAVIAAVEAAAEEEVE